ncbi:MAG TPA: TIGR00374 family protein, partial [Candidatus Limnocylindria bacterium]
MAERSGRPRWMRDAGRGLLLLVTAVSLYLLLPSLISVFSSWRSLAHLNWYWAGLALLAEIASFVSLWKLDRIALQTTNWFAVACAQLSGNAFGRIVPGGGATASAFAVGMLGRAGIEVGRAA